MVFDQFPKVIRDQFDQLSNVHGKMVAYVNPYSTQACSFNAVSNLQLVSASTVIPDLGGTQKSIIEFLGGIFLLFCYSAMTYAIMVVILSITFY